jgi:predicted nucleic acid-binding protein
MVMMAANVFVDTNVLLRATILQFPLHRAAIGLIARQIETGAQLWISRQVLREYLAQATRPQSFMNAMTMQQVEPHLQAIRALYRIADETEQVTRHLLALLRAHPTAGKQVHDANIVATMLVNGIDTLLTQNIDDMKRFTEITLIPLAENSP